MLTYLVLLLSLLCVSATLIGFRRSAATAKAEKKAHDDIASKFEVVLPSTKELASKSETYEKLQSKYKRQRSKLLEAQERSSLYQVGSGSVDSVMSLDARELSEDELEGCHPTTYLGRLADSLKLLVREKKACISEYKGEVVINDSRALATKFFNRDAKLRLRCLDTEFLLAKAVIDWNNVDRLAERCELVFREINKAGKLMKTRITKQYFDLKVLELRLTYQIKNAELIQKARIREEAAIEREKLREENRLKNETKRLEKQKTDLEKLVARELKKIKGASAEQLIRFESMRAKLEQLEASQQRARAMSELTRAGHVYVISNPDSFGESICKVGMTRRLDPMDRVKELGDASVPHSFKVHAFAYTSDAPKLEAMLHNELEPARVNLVNKRREFFYAEPASVVERIKQFDPDAELQTFA